MKCAFNWFCKLH
uniref:Uncharacterized protein n=1 Tax=Arundo donax TaxID=35708 RepID=A0A0A9B9E3_ARUDO